MHARTTSLALAHHPSFHSRSGRAKATTLTASSSTHTHTPTHTCILNLPHSEPRYAHASCTCHSESRFTSTTTNLATHMHHELATQQASLHPLQRTSPYTFGLQNRIYSCMHPVQNVLDSLITCGMICVEAARERAEKLVVVAQRTQKAVTPFLKTRSETIPDEE